MILRYVQHDTFTKGLAKATQAMRKPILDRFRDFKTPSGRRYGDTSIRTMMRQDIDAALKDKKPNAQRNWMKTIRPLIAFAIAKASARPIRPPTIKTARAGKSDGLTWGTSRSRNTANDTQTALWRGSHWS